MYRKHTRQVNNSSTTPFPSPASAPYAPYASWASWAEPTFQGNMHTECTCALSGESICTYVCRRTNGYADGRADGRTGRVRSGPGWEGRGLGVWGSVLVGGRGLGWAVG